MLLVLFFVLKTYCESQLLFEISFSYVAFWYTVNCQTYCDKKKMIECSECHKFTRWFVFCHFQIFCYSVFFFLCITFKVAFVCDQIISAVAENTSLRQRGSMFKNLFSLECSTRIINNSIKWKCTHHTKPKKLMYFCQYIKKMDKN